MEAMIKELYINWTDCCMEVRESITIIDTINEYLANESDDYYCGNAFGGLFEEKEFSEMYW